MPKKDSFAQLPLRQRKYARTKLGLLGAALRKLETRPLDSLTVRELCDAIPVSQASFFNYFPQKRDLLVYYVQLWSLKMNWHAKRLAACDGGLAAIEGIFRLTAREAGDRPGVMPQIIAGQVHMTEKPNLPDISLAERLLAFPEMEGIEEVSGMGLDDLLPPFVEHALRAGEIPDSANHDAVLFALRTIFFGVPVALLHHDPDAMEQAYLSQLRLLWTGLWARSRGEGRCE